MEIDLIQDKTILLSEKQAIVSQINVIDAQRQDLIVQLTIVNGIIEKYIDKKFLYMHLPKRILKISVF